VPMPGAGPATTACTRSMDASFDTKVNEVAAVPAENG